MHSQTYTIHQEILTHIVNLFEEHGMVTLPSPSSNNRHLITLDTASSLQSIKMQLEVIQLQAGVIDKHILGGKMSDWLTFNSKEQQEACLILEYQLLITPSWKMGYNCEKMFYLLIEKIIKLLHRLDFYYCSNLHNHNIKAVINCVGASKNKIFSNPTSLLTSSVSVWGELVKGMLTGLKKVRKCFDYKSNQADNKNEKYSNVLFTWQSQLKATTDYWKVD